jgi:hypothetical protein
MNDTSLLVGILRVLKVALVDGLKDPKNPARFTHLMALVANHRMTPEDEVLAARLVHRILSGEGRYRKETA